MRRDLLLVFAVLVAGLIERAIIPESTGDVLRELVGALALAVPLYWLRRHPPQAMLGLIGGGVLNQAIGAASIGAMFVPLALVILGSYTVARQRSGRVVWQTMALLIGALGVAQTLVVGDGMLFVMSVAAGGAVGGTLVRRQAEMTRQLAERTQELDALRVLGERDAMLAERRRIARELHDVVAHTVSVMVVQSGGARRQVALDPARALAALDQVEATGTETLSELRRLFGLLHPHDAPGVGLADLGALVARVRAAGLDVTLDLEPSGGALPAGAELAAYRLVQEALTNTLKHAGPSASAAVSVAWADDAATVVVRDTGWGSGGPRGDGSRRGLVGMRERVESFGGQVAAGPCPDGGFEVRATLPVVRQEVHVA
jgi:signal transduction histidine kinase